MLKKLLLAGAAIALAAGSASAKELNAIGITLGSLGNPFFVALAAGAEAKAKEIYGADKVVALKYNLAGNGKSKILKTAGEIKLVQVKDGAVVGVHMVGDRIGEQAGEAQLIYNWEALPAEVAQLIHAHPTQNEALGEAHLALAGKPLHSHD